ncbi:cytochrome P450 [Aspergillus sclerotioniger CBS 115572]|uniref:Cytochrome P450 n=1 Tax=Aspergillus sclerotioniger CBS 115572 TaxID=1450535 RepID=A0A317WTG2_9EURO|nr:cytochrome P450 [Aspergillus sclerotioniger CBS 115572]PWY88572.1 cytochrome P450 [Aspergillus sclerotioniger CBS 115572]
MAILDFHVMPSTVSQPTGVLAVLDSILFARAKKEFGNRLCALRIAGQDIVLVTTAAQISVVDKECHIYAFEHFVDLMYDEMAKVSRESKPILWRTPAEGYVSIFPNPKQMSCAHTGIALLHKQFSQPDALRCFMANSLASINQTLQWGSFYNTSMLRSASDVKVISLDFLCRDVIMDAQVISFFGPRLLELEPNLRTILNEWDFESWRVSYKLPSVLAKRATRLRDWLVDILTDYYSVPAEQRPGSVAFVNELYDDCKHAGLPDRDISGIMFTILWGLTANPTVLSFWMIAHLARNSTVITQIREEIAPLMQEVNSHPETSGASLYELTKNPLLTQCPILNSVFYETLRYTSTGSSFRKTTRDTTLEGRHIPQGTIVAIPQRVQMMSEEAFGPDPSSFDYYRFHRDKSLLRKVEFRGFGGGTTLCSGRIAGRHLVLAYVAILLWRYDVEIIGPDQQVLGVRGKPFPRLDKGKPSLGPAQRRKGEDLILKVTQRN